MPNQEMMALVKRIAEYEGGLDEKSFEARAGWRWRDVGIWPATLTRLKVEGLVDDGYESNSYHGYKLSNKARELLSVIPTAETTIATTSASLEVPEDLFQVIEGYDDIKGLVRQVLDSEKPVHLLFTGTPGSAKTMFLLELSRLGASYVLGSQASKAGMIDLLFEAEPRILLVDEIDRIGSKDIAILLSLMETGMVVETKHGKTRRMTLATKVFAASNTLKMPRELLSRFMALRFRPYQREQFLQVAAGLLRKREGVEESLAAYIAGRLWAMGCADPRQAVRVARLARSQAEVDRVIEIIGRYSDAV